MSSNMTTPTASRTRVLSSAIGPHHTYYFLKYFEIFFEIAQNFEIAIFFNVFESSWNYIFEDDKSPSPQGKSCKKEWSYKTSERAHWIGNQSSSAKKRVKVIGRHLPPPPHNTHVVLSRNELNRNLIVI